MARAELAQSKLEQLRREAVEDEMKNVQATPKINSRSRALAKRGRGVNGDGEEVSIADRQTKRYQEELERRERVRKEQEEKQIKDLQQTPKINKRSRAMAESQRKKMNTTHQSIADRQAERRRQELLRHEEKKRRQDQITMEEMRRTKPKVSRGSARILRKMEREGKRSTTTTAGDRLYQHAEVLQQKKEKSQRVPKFAHTPNTIRTKQSAAAQAETARRDAIEQRYGLSTNDRLYLEAQAKEHRKAMATAESKLWERFDQETGEELFQPKILRTKKRRTTRMRSGSNESYDDEVDSGGYDERDRRRGGGSGGSGGSVQTNNYHDSSGRRGGDGRGSGGSSEATAPVHVRLARKKKEYDDKRQQKKEKEKNRLEHMRKKGAVTSEKSKSILERAERRGEMTPTGKRLTQNIGAVRSRTIEEMDHPTFRPKIHQAPSEKKKKMKMTTMMQKNAKNTQNTKNTKNSKNSQKAHGKVQPILKKHTDRLRMEDSQVMYASSPGSVAKHSSALSREEVIEYRKMQQEKEREEVQEKTTRVERERKTKKQRVTTTASTLKKKNAAAMVTAKTKTKKAVSTTTTSRNRAERHATRKSTTTNIHRQSNIRMKQLPNRHRNNNSGLSSSSSSPTTGIKEKKKQRTVTEDATSKLLRARLLSSRRKTPTRSNTDNVSRKENIVSEEQRGADRDREEMKDAVENTSSIPSSSFSSETSSSAPLPVGWSEFVNAQGFVYYAHADGRSQWNTPTRTRLKKGRAAELMRGGQQNEVPTTTTASPSREELDNIIRGMGSQFLENWKAK